MQVTNKTQSSQFHVVTTSQATGAATGNGPTPIAPELLQLIGGGKVAVAPTVALPVGKW